MNAAATINPATTIEFRENRAKFSLAELQKYAGQWVAFSADGRRIVGSGEKIFDLFNQLRDAKETVAFERVEIDSGDSYMGSAELT